MLSFLLAFGDCARRTTRLHNRHRIRAHRVAAPQPQANVLCYGSCTADIGANVRSGPSTDNSIVTAVAYGANVGVNGKSGNWWSVNVNSCDGYILGSLLSVPGVVSADGGLNVRSGPGTGYSRTGGLSDGTSVTITDISEDSGWYYVTGSGISGYVSADYITLSGSSSSGGGSSSGGSSSGEIIRQTNSGFNSNIRNYGCGFMCCCWCGGVNSVSGCNTLYNKAVSNGWMGSDCYIYNWAYMATGIAGANSYQYATAYQYPPSNAKEILQCANSKTTMHFVVGNGGGSIEYDPYYDGWVSYSDCQNKRFFYY